jgi:hypothetical protein
MRRDVVVRVMVGVVVTGLVVMVRGNLRHGRGGNGEQGDGEETGEELAHGELGKKMFKRRLDGRLRQIAHRVAWAIGLRSVGAGIGGAQGWRCLI